MDKKRQHICPYRTYIYKTKRHQRSHEYLIIAGFKSKKMQNLVKVKFIAALLFVTAMVYGQSENSLWYQQEAERWNQCLPVGNGWLGAMTDGGINKETIYLNEETIWSGAPYFKETPDMLAHVPEYRELWLAGKYAEAEALAKKYMSIPNDARYGSFRPLGKLFLTNNNASSPISNYKRELDFAEATAKVNYTSDGVNYSKRLYASNPDSVIILHLSADKPGQINYTIALERQYRASTKTVGNNTLQMNGHTEHGSLKFSSLLKVNTTSGSVSSKDGKLMIKGADEATIYITAASTYRYKEPLTKCESIMARVENRKETDILADHKADFGMYYNRVELNIASSTTDNKSHLPTDERLKAFRQKNAEDVGFSALYFNYGRYLLISSSREGTLAANLQGIWNPLYNPPWFSDYTMDINIEMNYWLSEPCNLSELSYPMFELIDNIKPYGRKAAKARYNCRGFVSGIRTSPWYNSELRSATFGVWQEGAAWAFQQMWEHYQYTGDEVFLKERLYPTLKEITEFYYDFQIKDPNTGWWVTGPAYSPENKYIIPNTDPSKKRQVGSLSMGPTMANQVINDIFHQYIKASETLGVDKAFRKQIENRLEDLPQNQIGSKGQLQEWLVDFKEAEPGHRHMSHLYGLSPSNQITLRGTPELATAAKRTIELRKQNGGGWTGWSSAWMVNIWTRLEEGDKAYAQVKEHLQRWTYDNLFDLHPRGSNSVFQIDGNFGTTNGIVSMLLTSHAGEVQLLPALPSAYNNGSVSGLRARGGLTLDIQWKNNQLTTATVKADRTGTYIFRYGDDTLNKKIKTGQEVTLTAKDFNQ